MNHPSLRRPPSNLVSGRWVPVPGEDVCSRNPARPQEKVWSGSPPVEHVDEAVDAARRALRVWSRVPFADRAAALRAFQRLCKERAGQVAELICDETGKAMWDAKAEADLLAAKMDITLAENTGANWGLARVAPYEVPVGGSRVGRCWFRPHGVMAVVGPFNFPAHLPNGHIIPALAMGNTIVFKPSDKAPGVGQILAELLQEAMESAGAPPGVVNLVQGGADVASTLSSHTDIDGVLFTGSWPVGRKILEANIERPGRIIALEMGGNNPAVVMDDADLKQAAIECVRSAFVTTGQRCTCTRRVVVHEAVAERFVGAVCKAAAALAVADPRSPGPVFMGPIISDQARQAVLEFQKGAPKHGGEVLLEARAAESETGGWYITPGVMRVDKFVIPPPQPGVSAPRHTAAGGMPVHPGRVDAGCDVEIFGPLLRLSVVPDLDEAIEQANATRFGLAASIFTRDPANVERFLAEAKAGCINVNTGTAGASSKLPFGGLGHSGNHRPAGAFSLDYCAYPVAGMVESADAAQLVPGMRFDDGWI